MPTPIQLSQPVNAQNNAIASQRQQQVNTNFVNYQNAAAHKQYAMTNATNYANIANKSYSASGASYVGSALSGAATGATLGSFVPGIGTAIGAAVGALSGLVGAYGNNKRQKNAQEYNERQIDKQNAFNAEQAELAHKRQLEQIDYAQAIENAQYEKYYSPSAQKRQLQDAGLSTASMYSSGYQGTSVPSAPSASSPSASSVGTASVPLDSSATTQGVAVDNARLQLDALSVGANNTRTLADATRISIDNTTANARNVSEILKNYAEIDKLKSSGALDNQTAERMRKMLEFEMSSMSANTRLTNITADNTAAVMQSTAANNNASAAEHSASSSLKVQQTITEKHNSELMRFKSYREDFQWSTERNKLQIANDVCARYGIDKKNSSWVMNVIDSVSKQSGVDLVNITAKTLFSWLDFSNWKNIFSTNSFTSAQRDIAAQNLEQQMKFHNDDMSYRDDDLLERLSKERGVAEAAYQSLTKAEKEFVQRINREQGFSTAMQTAIELAKKHSNK